MVADVMEKSLCISFKDNTLLPALFGEHGHNLETLEKKLNVTTASRGNTLSITGDIAQVQAARVVLETLYNKLERGQDIDPAEVDAAIRMVREDTTDTPADTLQAHRRKAHLKGELVVKTRKKQITPYSHNQGEYIRALLENDLVFGTGPAGTGKTYLAVAVAVAKFINGEVERIILSRPAVEAGERLGFLPGDLREKIDPYLRPLYDALHDMLPAEKVMKYLEDGTIEIAPLAFMRGRTLSNAYVILDEAQNTTPMQMKMFLTRLGEDSCMAVSGDLSQTDLPSGQKSGLRDAIEKLEGLEGIASIRFREEDVVRHPLAARIVQAYEESEKQQELFSEKELNGADTPESSD